MSILATVALGGCSTPLLTLDEIRGRAAGDRATLAALQAPVPAKMSLSDAVTRALLYNLELRAEGLSQQMEEDAEVLASLGLLPNVTGSLSTIHGSRSRASSSDGDVDAPFTSRRVAALKAQWSSLNFSISYLAARRQSNENHAARERRQRVAGMLVNEVSYYFYRSLNAESRLKQLDALERHLDRLDSLANKVRTEGLDDPLPILSMQAELYNLKRRFGYLRRDIEISQEKLARLLNLSPNHHPFLSAKIDHALIKAALKIDVERATNEALILRPELREFDYRERNTRLDIWQSYVDLFPNITGFYSNSSNLNKHPEYGDTVSREAGLSVAYQLISLATFPWKLERAKLNQDIVSIRRLAMSLSVIEQVRSSFLILEQIAQEVNLAEKVTNIEGRIEKLWGQRQPFNVNDEMMKLRAKIDNIMASIESDNLLAEQQKVLGELLLAIGISLAPEQLDLTDPTTVQLQVKSHLEKLTEKVELLARSPSTAAQVAPATPRAVRLRDARQ